MLTTESQLLLACAHGVSRGGSSDEEWAAEVLDWPRLQRMARHHLMVPLLCRHLARWPEGVIPEPARQALSLDHKEAVRRSLLLQGELQRLVKTHLEPRGIAYVTLKGPTLAARYYGDPTARQCRDLDVLVAPSRLFELVAALLEAGYRLKEAHLVNGLDDLRAYCEMAIDVGVVSPLGVLIELHQRLDFTGCQYRVDIDRLLSDAQWVDVAGEAYPAMSTTELFVYICYHHGKHHWSRMHWVADLNALIQHASFDISAVLARAKELGLGRMVASALLLHESLSGQRLPWPAPDSGRFGKGVVQTALHYLRDDSVAPEQINKVQLGNVVGLLAVRAKIFVYHWQANTRWANRLCYLLSVARGSYTDYLFLPLPRKFYSLYPVLKPVRWVLEFLHLKRFRTAR